MNTVTEKINDLIKYWEAEALMVKTNSGGTYFTTSDMLNGFISDLKALREEQKPEAKEKNVREIFIEKFGAIDGKWELFTMFKLGYYSREEQLQPQQAMTKVIRETPEYLKELLYELSIRFKEEAAENYILDNPDLASAQKYTQMGLFEAALRMEKLQKPLSEADKGETK